MAYNRDTDYQEKINEAAARGDYAAAKSYEAQRNEKIDGEGLDVPKTYNYQTAGVGKIISSGAKREPHKSTADYGNYNSEYSRQIADMMSKVLNREDFSYDPETDETYKQYEKSYTKAGQRAMRDTAGDIASRTGGIASSYAASAASQAYDNYMAALADKIPELKQAAYKMYNDEYERDLAKLGILQNSDESAYQRYLTDRSFNYQLNRDKVEDMRADRDFNQREYQFDANRRDANNQFQQKMDYDNFWNTMNYGQNAEQMRLQMGRNAIGDDRYERQLAAEEEQRLREEAFKRWTELGYADQDVEDVLGIPVGTKTAEKDYQDWYRAIYERSL